MGSAALGFGPGTISGTIVLEIRLVGVVFPNVFSSSEVGFFGAARF